MHELNRRSFRWYQWCLWHQCTHLDFYLPDPRIAIAAVTAVAVLLTAESDWATRPDNALRAACRVRSHLQKVTAGDAATTSHSMRPLADLCVPSMRMILESCAFQLHSSAFVAACQMQSTPSSDLHGTSE